MVADRKSGAQKKRVDKSGLGRAIINRKVKQAKIAADPTLHSSEISAGLSSVTQENDLDEFLSTAQLADTSFAAEKQNVRVVTDPSLSSGSSGNAYLLSQDEERQLREKQSKHAERVQVPRRPAWTSTMTKVELERQERDSFLEWRRNLADLTDNQNLLLTPFERNLEVWRQLWRTLERSDLIVQIVDARNPLAFRSTDLEKYVVELSVLEARGDKGEGSSTPKKKNLLLINKSDLLTEKQRRKWADYFEANNISYAFFSAANAAALQEQRQQALDAAALAPDTQQDSDGSGNDDNEEEEDDLQSSDDDEDLSDESDDASDPTNGHDEVDSAPASSTHDATSELAEQLNATSVTTNVAADSRRTRILSVLELEDLFLSEAPQDREALTVGLVGYPNVGKSSTINALIGEKKVSVSATPGKTKHFQTIKLSDRVLLCDCPGLVFPQFASTKADLVCNGVLPIDQMREHTGPVSLVAQRIPKEVLDGIYGLTIPVVPVDEGGTGQVTASALLSTYAIARGFFTSGQGNADESRASRFILKDYVNGKVLYCHPPPGVTPDEFNAENRDMQRLEVLERLRARKAPVTRVRKNADTFIPSASNASREQGTGPRQSRRADVLDSSFFVSPHVGGIARVAGSRAQSQYANQANGFTRSTVPYLNDAVNDDGTPVSARKMRLLAAQAQQADGSSKKHFKPKRSKQRSGRGYE